MVNDLADGDGVEIPSIADRLNVNLPIAGAAGKLAFSILSKDYLLDLELSALQAENKGEVVSTPRVVTVDKKKASIEKGVDVPYETESASGGTNMNVTTNTNVAEATQISQELPKQSEERNNSNIDGADTLQKIEDDFGKNLMLDMSQVSKNL